MFGNFPKPLSALYPGDSLQAQIELSDSMMSYWAELAYSGNPRRGRDGTGVLWSAWQNSGDNAERLLILDTQLDRGIRMSTERISIADLKARLFADNSFTDQEEHCSTYKRLFRNGDFVQSEYKELGKEGCE